MTMTALSPSLAQSVTAGFARKRRMAIAVPAVILAYLIYAAISFDVASLVQRARFDNAAILLSDFWSHKTHVTRDNRTGDLTVAIEGENKGTYPPGMLPDWVTVAGDVTTIDLGTGHVVTYDDAGARFVAAADPSTRAMDRTDGDATKRDPEPLGQHRALCPVDGQRVCEGVAV